MEVELKTPCLLLIDSHMESSISVIHVPASCHLHLWHSTHNHFSGYLICECFQSC